MSDEKNDRVFDLTDESLGGEEPRPVSPAPPLPPEPRDPLDVSSSTDQVRSAARSVATELAEEWARIQGRPAPQPRVGPPPPPAGHAPLPTSLPPQSSSTPQRPPAPLRSDVATTPAPAPAESRPGPIAPPVVGELPEREPRRIVEDREVVLPLDLVLCDPRDNHARCGAPWLLDDSEVVETAEAIEAVGLINPIGIRELPEPIEREAPSTVSVPREDGGSERRVVTHYAFRVIDGFKRYAALRRLGRSTGRFSLRDVDDAEAMAINGIENFVRSDPTEYQEARYYQHYVRSRGWTVEDLARTSGSKPFRVAALVSLVERLPPALLEVFEQSPTREVRRELTEVAKIERPTIEETHQAMIDQYVEIQAQKKTEAEAEKALPPERRPRAGKTPRTMNRIEVESFRVSVRNASEWFDEIQQSWRPVTDDARAYADAMLRCVCAPRTRRPLR